MTDGILCLDISLDNEYLAYVSIDKQSRQVILIYTIVNVLTGRQV